MPLQSGFSRRDITPQEPCFLVGYPHVERTSTGVHDPLYASALCVEQDGTTLLILSLDVLFVSADWTRKCRERITMATGIPAHQIMIGATHTHSGPHTADILAWRDDPVVPPVDEAYLDFASTQATAAAGDAWRVREPAEAAWTSANVRGLAGGNRVDPNGAEDPEAALLLVRRTVDQVPLAVLAVYGMHPTVLHEDSSLISSDFIAFTRRSIEEKFAGAGVVYLNGVCGNQSPRRAVRTQTFGEAERIGSALGVRMVEALDVLSEFSTTPVIRAKSMPVRIDGKNFPSVDEAAAGLALALARFEELKKSGAERAVVRTAECTLFGAEEVLTLAKAEADGEAEILRQKYREAEVQVLRIGEVFLAAWPGEFFVEHGLAAKAQCSGKLHIATMANGELQGYVVTPEAEAAGGYEAQMSLFPSTTGIRFVEATLELIRQIS